MRPQPNCIVCHDPALTVAVDSLLREGRSVRDIASAVGRSKSAVDRHKAHTVGRNREAGVSPAQKSGRTVARTRDDRTSQTGRKPGHTPKRKRRIKSRDDLLDELHEILDDVKAILREARDKSDPRLALQAVARVEALVSRIGEAEQILAPAGSTFIDQRNVDTKELLDYLRSLPREEQRALAAGATDNNRDGQLALPTEVTIEAEIIEVTR